MTSSRAAIRSLLHPAGIAVVGATESPGYGRRLMENLLGTHHGIRVMPVNPLRRTVLGVPCAPRLTAIEGQVDVAMVVVPAAATADVIAEAREARLAVAVVISAGFAEIGDDGVNQDELVAAGGGVTRIVGPNCLGYASVTARLWAAANVLAPRDEHLRAGKIAILSQSGATAFGPLLWSARRYGIGLGPIVSSGNEADLAIADFLESFVADGDVEAVIVVLEGTADPLALRRALMAARQASMPVVVLRIGSTEAGARAALSHTAAIAGSGQALGALLHRWGIAEARNWDEALLIADALTRLPPPVRDGVGVLSHSGGIGGAIADAVASRGLPIPPLDRPGRDRLSDILDGRGSAENPADITFHAERGSILDVLDILAQTPGVGMIAAATGGSAALGARLAGFAESHPIPVLACWTGGTPLEDSVAAGLRESRLGLVYQPDQCGTVLAALWHRPRSTPRHVGFRRELEDPDAWLRIQDAIVRAAGESVPDYIGLALLRDLGMSVAALTTCSPVDDPAACRARAGLAFPLVAKLSAPDLPHRAKLGLIASNLHDDRALGDAARLLWRINPSERAVLTLQERVPAGRELLLGYLSDPLAGPVLVLGKGGASVAVIGEHRFLPLPLEEDPRDLIHSHLRAEDRFSPTLENPSESTLDAAARAIDLFAHWAWSVRDAVASMEVNPLIVGRGHAIAVDCLIVPARRRTREPSKAAGAGWSGAGV